jgi:hypothetical protein
MLATICMLSWIYQVATQHNVVMGVTSFISGLYVLHVLGKTKR